MMAATDPIAYTYDADYHCPACAIKAHGQELGRPWPTEGATDSEGNEIGALAPWDEWYGSLIRECEALACADCLELIDTAHRENCSEDFGELACTLTGAIA